MVKFDCKINKRADLHDFRPYELTRWGTTVQICKLGVFFAIFAMKKFP